MTNFEKPSDSPAVHNIFDQQGTLCHKVIHFDALQRGEYRRDISLASEFLQLGVIVGPQGKDFRAHIHLERTVAHERFIAQESWVIIRGKVRANFYDEGGRFLISHDLAEGDLSITFRGGHGYQLLEDSVVYEFKTGPYLGQTIDKKFIG